jgi:hypothetical protein
MVKPGLAKPQFPMVQCDARRSIPDAATSHYRVVKANAATLSAMNTLQ